MYIDVQSLKELTLEGILMKEKYNKNTIEGTKSISEVSTISPFLEQEEEILAKKLLCSGMSLTLKT